VPNRGVRRARAGSIPTVDGTPGFREAYEDRGRRFARRVVRALLKGFLRRLSPNAVTVSGCVLCGVAAVLVFREQLLAASIVFLLGSVLDAMDGAVAKVTGKVSAFGAFLDSTLDRVGEGLVLGGLGLMFAKDGNLWPLASCFVALACSYLVSYTRAKAESLGVACKGGLASRVERVVVLSVGLFLASFWPVALEFTVHLLAVTAALTVIQRVLHVHRALPAGRKPRRRRRSRARRSTNVQPETPTGGPPG
jgi:CDP-diacylglycerol---glycerol-3-phosphate 3-phosphatidyltransferase